ncbi:transketolase, partial [Acinetobacter baumannii]
LGWPENKDFFVPREVLRHMRRAIANGAAAEKQWNAAFSRYAKDFPEEAKELRRRISGDLPAGWEKALPRFSKPEAKATRAYSGEVINAIA